MDMNKSFSMHANYLYLLQGEDKLDESTNKQFTLKPQSLAANSAPDAPANFEKT